MLLQRVVDNSTPIKLLASVICLPMPRQVARLSLLSFGMKTKVTDALPLRLSLPPTPSRHLSDIFHFDIYGIYLILHTW